MRRTLSIGLSAVALIAFVGCGHTQTAASWAFGLVKWNNHTYKVTTETVSTVGEQVGVVTNYSDDETASETGAFSNEYPVGTKLFSVPNISTPLDIAVQTKNGKYLKAVNQDKQ